MRNVRLVSVVALVALSGCALEAETTQLESHEDALLSSDLPFPAIAALPMGTLPVDGSTTKVTLTPPGGLAAATPVAAFRLRTQLGLYASLDFRPQAERVFRDRYPQASWQGKIDPIFTVYPAAANVGDRALLLGEGSRPTGAAPWKSAEGSFGETNGDVLAKDYIVVLWHNGSRTPFGAQPRDIFVHSATFAPSGAAESICVERGPGYPNGPECLRSVPLSSAQCVETSGGPYGQCIRYEEMPQGPTSGG